jgi:hypothetical protein
MGQQAFEKTHWGSDSHDARTPVRLLANLLTEIAGENLALKRQKICRRKGDANGSRKREKS